MREIPWGELFGSVDRRREPAPAAPHSHGAGGLTRLNYGIKHAMRSRPPALFALSLSVLLAPACVDTSVPEITLDFGDGRTAGPPCSPTELEFFPPEELRMHIIDVGQGDAIWIQTPYYENELLESRNILIDAGPSGNVPGTSPGGGIVVAYMLTHGLVVGDVLHALVLTHAHEDHYGGAATIASTFEIERYVDPGFSADSQGFLSVRSAAESDVRRLGGDIGVPAVGSLVPRLYAATDLFGEYVEAQLLWAAVTPPSGNVSSPSGTDINNTSVAFALRWGLNQVLLLGDLEKEVEAALVAAHDAGEIQLASRVLKVAHHGSSSSSTLGFLARVFPPPESDQNWAVISSGRRSFNGVTLPTDETIRNLKEVLLEGHILSTENDDTLKSSGTEHDDDHILVRLRADGRVDACYGF